MADLSKKAIALFSGSRRIGLVPTLVIAAAVTAAVAAPLTVRAIRASDDPPLAAADPSVVLVDMAATEPGPLDRSIVAGAVLISVNSPTTEAVSFSLFPTGGDEALLVSQDLDGPRFDLVVSETGGGSPLDTTVLPDGAYQLFLTLRGSEGDARTAVSFEVANT